MCRCVLVGAVKVWETTKQAVQTFYDTVDKRGDIAPCFDLDVAEVVHNSNVYKGDGE